MKLNKGGCRPGRHSVQYSANSLDRLSVALISAELVGALTSAVRGVVVGFLQLTAANVSLQREHAWLICVVMGDVTFRAARVLTLPRHCLSPILACPKYIPGR